MTLFPVLVRLQEKQNGIVMSGKSLRSIVVIPARLASSRFPEKILAKRTGKYLFQHTYEQALQAELIDKVIVAADDERTIQAAESFGAQAIMTDPALPSGTDRVSAAVKNIDCDIIVNLQADEPQMPPEFIDKLVKLLIDNPEVPMATLASAFTSREDIENPNNVKVIIDKANNAIYFSRSIIPYPREGFETLPKGFEYYHHFGIYAYRKDFLLALTKLEPAPIEQVEKLEQLRVLWNGYKIKVAITEYRVEGIDTIEEYEKFVESYGQTEKTKL